MAIHTEDVVFAANGGTCPGYLATPEGEGKRPAVVVIQEWWGLDEHIMDLARRFAAEGFVALAPDLYHGKKTAEPDEAMKLAMALQHDRAVVEIGGAVKLLKARPDVTGVGVVGFCLGGGLSFLTACRNREVGSAVVFYGGAPNPLDQIKDIQVPVLGLYAEDDERITSKVPEVSAAMAAAGKNFTYHIYPGTHHAFLNDGRPSTYNAGASADAWKWTLRFFRQNLG